MAMDRDDPYNQQHRPVRVLSRPPRSPRGVKLAPHAPDGYEQINVVTSEGELLVSMLVLRRLADQPGFITNLNKLLDREDPAAVLSIVS